RSLANALAGAPYSQLPKYVIARVPIHWVLVLDQPYNSRSPYRIVDIPKTHQTVQMAKATLIADQHSRTCKLSLILAVYLLLNACIHVSFEAGSVELGRHLVLF
ncbi:16201_t:CDS:2, partial [Acaulospora colombiana]